MASMYAETITSVYSAAVKKHGPSETAKMVVLLLLDEVVDQELKYAASSERKATVAEMAQTEIANEESTE